MSHKKKNKKMNKEMKEQLEKIEAIEVKEIKTKKTNTKRKNIFLYFLMMVGVFALIDFGLMLITSDLFNMVSYYKYGNDIISEIFYAILVLIVMLLFKNSYVFTTRQEKLTRSIVMAAPLLLFSTVMLITNLTDL